MRYQDCDSTPTPSYDIDLYCEPQPTSSSSILFKTLPSETLRFLQATSSHYAARPIYYHNQNSSPRIPIRNELHYGGSRTSTRTEQNYGSSNTSSRTEQNYPIYYRFSPTSIRNETMASLIHPQDFPFELSKIFPPEIPDNEETSSLSDSSSPPQIAIHPPNESITEFPITYYQPHFRRHKRPLAYEKHLSSFSTLDKPPSNGAGFSPCNEILPDIDEEVTMDIDQSSSSGGESLKNSKEKNRDEIYGSSNNNTKIKEMEYLFEFSDLNLKCRLGHDINCCKKDSRNVNRKIQWKKMTPELFQEIYQWEKTQPRVKQCDIQSKFHVNRSTYYRWKKKHLSSHPDEPEELLNPN